jgi:hypothetical protein
MNDRSASSPNPERRNGRPESPRISALDDLDDILVAIVAEHGPMTARDAFYRAVRRKAVENTTPAAALVARTLRKLEQNGRIPYGAIWTQGGGQ